jgi:hypothetical protein
MFYNIAGSDYHTKSLKAEAAAKFNQFAALLPPARGWIHGILAILFVLAVASLGFGSIRFMQAWLLALTTISFYKPVAVLGYKMAEYFTTNSEYLEAVTKIQNDPLLLGGARIIQDQLAQIQTVYLCFEIGAFAVFVAGAIGCFRALTNMTNSVAGTVSHHSTALLMKGYHLATGAVGGIAAGPAVMSGATGVGMGTAQQQPNVFVNVSHGATHWNQANDSFTSPTTPSHWQGGAFGKGSQI